MWKSLQKNLLFSCILVVALSSCSPLLINNFRRNTNINGEDWSWFGNYGESLLCRTSIRAWSSEFTGVMIIKPFSGNYRCLFMTETGLKIFDLEVRKDGSYKMHYCLEQLDRKSVVKLLAQDFGMMIYPLSDEGKNKFMKQGKSGPAVIRAKDERGVRFMWLNENDKISRLVRSGALFRKFEISFKGRSTIPQTITIKHYFLNIQINLSTIEDVAK